MTSRAASLPAPVPSYRDRPVPPKSGGGLAEIPPFTLAGHMRGGLRTPPYYPPSDVSISKVVVAAGVAPTVDCWFELYKNNSLTPVADFSLGAGLTFESTNITTVNLTGNYTDRIYVIAAEGNAIYVTIMLPTD